MLKNDYLKIVFSICFTWMFFAAQSQVNLGNDTTICSASSFTLNINGQEINAIQIPIASDDIYSSAIPIGFPFEFYGNTYTQLVVSSNNYISFNLAYAGTGSPWSITTAIPNPANPLNAIMCPWQDVNPGVGGVINYAVVGNAPNRIFVVSFIETPMYSCTNLCFTDQIKLFEGTNIIETHITSKPTCPSWNGGAAIHGLHNSDGTVADVVPGRNYPAVWSTVDDGYRFTPNGVSAYTITPIPYAPHNIYNQSPSLQITWYLNGSNIGNGTTLQITPTTSGTYIGQVQFMCSGQTYRDTINVYVSDTDISSSSTNVLCNGDNSGTALVEVTGSSDPFNYVWRNDAGAIIRTMNGVTATEDSISGLVAGDYTVELTDSMGCVLTEAIVIDEPAAIQVDSSHTNILCNGETNGTASVVVAGGTPPYIVEWNDPTQQTGNNAMNLGPGNYTATVTDDNGCIFEQDFVILQPAPLVLVATSRTDTCEQGKGTATVAVSGATSPYNYSWRPVSGNDSILSGLLKGTYSVIVTDDNGCVDSTSISVGNIPSPVADFQFSVQPDDIFKPLVFFDNESEDANTYFWDFGDQWNGTSTDTNPTYRYDTARTFPVILVAYGQYDGCVDTAINFVTVNPVYAFYIPNAFTPGSLDELNDTFGPVGNAYDVDSYYMTIYDRWGSIIYQTSDFVDGAWDGQSHRNNQPAPDGVYVYRIDIKTFSGFDNHKYVGTVALIRQR